MFYRELSPALAIFLLVAWTILFIFFFCYHNINWLNCVLLLIISRMIMEIKILESNTSFYNIILYQRVFQKLGSDIGSRKLYLDMVPRILLVAMVHLVTFPRTTTQPEGRYRNSCFIVIIISIAYIVYSCMYIGAQLDRLHTSLRLIKAHNIIMLIVTCAVTLLCLIFANGRLIFKLYGLVAFMQVFPTLLV